MSKHIKPGMLLPLLALAVCLSVALAATEAAGRTDRVRIPIPVEQIGSGADSERGCSWLDYSCAIAWANPLPDPFGAGHEFYNQRFTPDSLCTLATVELAFYQGASSGNPGAEIYIWNSDGTFPTSVITTVPIDTVSNWFPVYESVDVYSAGIVVSSDFHVGYSPIRYSDADTLAIISDDGSCGDNRASGLAGGSWHPWTSFFGADENLFIKTEICCPEYGEGDHCSDPLTITIGLADLPYTLSHQTTCGLGDYYNVTCLEDYDGGEEMVIELIVADSMNVDITLDPLGTTMTGLCIDDVCPPDESCIRASGSTNDNRHALLYLDLTPATYYIMVDCKESQGCIPDFNLTISERVGTFAGELTLSNCFTECGIFNGTGLFQFGFSTQLTTGVSYLNLFLDLDDSGDCDSAEWAIKNVPIANISLYHNTHGVFFDLPELLRDTLGIYGIIGGGEFTGEPPLDWDLPEPVAEIPVEEDTLIGCDLTDIPPVAPEYDPQPREDSDPLGRTDMPDIPQHLNECALTSAANSLIWLAKRNGWEDKLLDAINFPDDETFELSDDTNPNGQSPHEAELIIMLKWYMNEGNIDANPYPGTPLDWVDDTHRGFFFGKQQFITDHRLELEVHGAPLDPYASGPTVFDFIKEELEKEEDVEITYRWEGCECGHMVTAVDIAIDDETNTAYVYIVDPGDGEGTATEPHVLIFTGNTVSGVFTNPKTLSCQATAESPIEEGPPEWNIHALLIDGWLSVLSTMSWQAYSLALIDTSYLPECTTVDGLLPLWSTGLKTVFKWDHVIEIITSLEIALPHYDYDDSTWCLGKLEEYLRGLLEQGEHLVLPSLGDSTGVNPNVYIVVDLAQWLESPRQARSTYDIVDGECDDLPGYLIGTTPIVFNPQAPSWDSPFETSRLTHTLVVDAEVGVGRRRDFLCGDAEGSEIVNISDAVYLIAYIFGGGPEPVPLLAGDVDCNDIVNISDAVYLIAFIFGGGPEPCAECP